MELLGQRSSKLTALGGTTSQLSKCVLTYTPPAQGPLTPLCPLGVVTVSHFSHSSRWESCF